MKNVSLVKEVSEFIKDATSNGDANWVKAIRKELFKTIKNAGDRKKIVSYMIDSGMTNKSRFEKLLREYFKSQPKFAIEVKKILYTVQYDSAPGVGRPLFSAPRSRNARNSWLGFDGSRSGPKSSKLMGGDDGHIEFVRHRINLGDFIKGKSTVADSISGMMKSKDVKVKKAAADKRVMCYVRSNMPREILVKKATEVEIIVSLEQIKKQAGKASASGRGKVFASKKLRVRVRGVVNIKVDSAKSEFNIKVPKAGQPHTIKSLVSATHKGICKLAIDLWQGQQLVCTLELVTACVDKVRDTSKAEFTAKNISEKPYSRPTVSLIITEASIGNSFYYDYRLDAPALNILKQYKSDVIKVDREKYVGKLYAEIEKLWSAAGNSAAQFAINLRSFGSKLFTSLLPADLQKDIYTNRKKIQAIEVLSTEPFIPWEMLLVRNPDQSKSVKSTDMFLGEMGLTRWLYNTTRSEQLSIRKGRAWYVIPDYTDTEFELSGSANEEKYLVEKFGAQAILPNPMKVISRLKKKGSFDLIHFCCHGEADTGNIMNSQLRLQNNNKSDESPAFLSESNISGVGSISKSADNRPLVVLNACQTGRLGNDLIGTGGFAQAFLKAGAGAFVGALWSIDDLSAVSFITTFYDALKKGKTLSKAAILARGKAKSEGGSTWLSYVVYGHPFAKLK
jgi:hypothetical protein